MSDAQPIVRKGIKLGVKRDADEFAESAQVIKENFPKQRSLHLQPKGGEPLTGERVDIVVTEEVLLATAHHVAQDTSKESGGFLLGNRYECPNTERQYIIIDQFMKADYTEGTQVSLTFTTDSWAQLTERMGGKYRGKQLVGWYHSHPGMGIFLSNYDLDIHKNRFANEWDVALVLDPIKHEGGFFAWVGGNVNPREKVDFYELLDGDSRETVTAWTNHTAVDPKTGAPAKLKAVNTQNSDGNPLSISATSQKSQAATASGGLFSNPL
ncbi:MAG TPA: Mov34/MPN/PAD-1 family protein, partial [Pyrinomonadaceae bacterium]|nr:Mov34/MPN/PAD-1 family protein [Pyrinomonadaceae bacterium]